MKRNKQVDGLRGIGILIIVFFHFTSRYSQLFGHAKNNYFLRFDDGGVIGVILFFILGAYFYMRTTSTIRDGGFWPTLRNKFLRLFPAYFVAVIVIFFSIMVFGLTGRVGKWLDLLLNLCMVNGFIGTAYIDGAHWYMTYQIVMIMLLGFLTCWGWQNKMWAYIGILCASLILRLIFRLGYGNGLLDTLFLLLLGGYLPFVVLGICIYQLEKSKKNMLAGALLLAMIVYIAFSYNYIVTGATVVSTVIFWLALQEKFLMLRNPILVYIGETSYAWYLIHQNIGYQIIRGLESIGLISEIYILIPMGVTFCLAILLHKLVELPCLTLIKRSKEWDGHTYCTERKEGKTC